MDILDKVLLEWSYRCEKGYPDINNKKDIALFESIFGFNLIEEAKYPFEYLSKEAQELGKELIQKLNLEDNEIIAHAKNRIIVYTDRPRQEVFQALRSLGYEKDQITGSSGGGFRTPEGIEIIHKAQTSIGDAGLGNEAILIVKVEEAISANGGPIDVRFIGKNKVNLDYTNVKGAKGVGEKTSDNKKADVVLITPEKTRPISVKEDKAFRWSSAMSTHRKVFDAVLKPAMGEGTEDLKLVQDEQNPKLLAMINPKNNLPYGSIYVFGAPDMDYKTLAFGSDNAVVVKASFEDKDFHLNNGILTIQTAGNYQETEDFTEDDKPIIRFERNASKATNLTGYAGRGITLRTVPAKGRINQKSRANTLDLEYKDLGID
jgi:hypothetical protein|tara:strand:- start:6326 stop:7450 length:1125 start_codon:yes stop_codon:yes gene_type:complete